MIERVLRKDTPVCGSQNASAFDKPHALQVMHHAVRDKIVVVRVALGEHEKMLTMNRMLERLRLRHGDRLGDPCA